MDERTCSVAGCDKGGTLTRGWCPMHYYRWRVHGSFDLPERPAVTCSVDGCERDGKLTRGWCQMHYVRWIRYGDPLFVKYIRGDTMARFWSKVDRQGAIPDYRPDLGPCWLWTDSPNDDGYGIFTVDRTQMYAARWIYGQMVDPIPAGCEPDHLCRVRACVNYLSHLEVVPKRENILRGNGPTAINARKTHCIHGHEFTPENTRINKRGNRGCRACHNSGRHG